jgi:hypothetical protein
LQFGLKINHLATLVDKPKKVRVAKIGKQRQSIRHAPLAFFITLKTQQLFDNDRGPI